MNKKPPCNCADWGMMECLPSCDSNKTWADIIKERDQLKSKLYIAETALKAVANRKTIGDEFDARKLVAAALKSINVAAMPNA